MPNDQASRDARRKRLAEIAAQMVADGRVDTARLAKKYKISLRMVQDDVRQLAQSEWGRGFRDAPVEYHLRQRVAHAPFKCDVASAVAELLTETPHASIGLTPGTTATLCFGMIVARRIACHVVTSSMAATEFPLPTGFITVHLTGGIYSADIHALVGEDAKKGYEFHKPRVCILGVSGIDGAGSLFVHHQAEYDALRALLAAVREKIIVVCDLSKLGRGGPWTVADIDALTRSDDRSREVVLVTNKPSATLRRNLGKGYAASCKVLKKLHAAASGQFSVVEADRDKEAYRQLRELVPWLKEAEANAEA